MKTVVTAEDIAQIIEQIKTTQGDLVERFLQLFRDRREGTDEYKKVQGGLIAISETLAKLATLTSLIYPDNKLRKEKDQMLAKQLAEIEILIKGIREELSTQNEET